MAQVGSRGTKTIDGTTHMSLLIFGSRVRSIINRLEREEHVWYYIGDTYMCIT